MSEDQKKQENSNEQPNVEATQTTTEAPSQEKDELTVLQEQLDQAKAAHLTAVADLENARKRFAREREEMLKFGPYSLAMDLLPFIDSFTLAIEAAQKHDTNATLDGFALLKAQLDSILENAQIKRVAPQKGDNFNPEEHESVAEAPSEEVEHHQILDVQRPGYSLHGRLLRPAMVILSSGKAQ